jgi:hypothetical protein
MTILLLPSGLGCSAAYFLTDPNEAKAVKADYGKIGDKKVAVVVWADQITLDVDPQARKRVGKAVSYHLRSNLPRADFINAREIAKLQSDPYTDWESMTNGELCEKLECEVLIRVDLVEYTTRASNTPELRKGRVRATVNAFECGKAADLDPVYSIEVATTYPPNSVHGTAELDEAELLHETIDLFAQETARKFYDHDIKLQNEPNW